MSPARTDAARCRLFSSAPRPHRVDVPLTHKHPNASLIRASAHLPHPFHFIAGDGPRAANFDEPPPNHPPEGQLGHAKIVPKPRPAHCQTASPANPKIATRKSKPENPSSVPAQHPTVARLAPTRRAPTPTDLRHEQLGQIEGNLEATFRPPSRAQVQKLPSCSRQSSQPSQTAHPHPAQDVGGTCWNNVCAQHRKPQLDVQSIPSARIQFVSPAGVFRCLRHTASAKRCHPVGRTLLSLLAAIG